MLRRLMRLFGSVVLMGPVAGAPAGEKVRSLCSFKEGEMAAKGYTLTPVEGKDFLTFKGLWDRPNLVRARHATEGRLALFAHYHRGTGPTRGCPRAFGYFGNSEKMAHDLPPEI